MARADEGDPAQLDRPLRGRRDPLPRRGAGHRHRGLHDAAGHAVRRDVLRRRARASVRRRARERGGEGVRAPRRRAARSRSARPTEAKTGVFTGLHAVNPVNGEKLPIWVADYVLMDYGTGAIMAVPAHDERDGEFAEAFELPDRRGDRRGREARQLRPFDGLPAEEAKTRDRRWLRERGPRRRRRSTTACATGASPASATGAARSRSSTASTAASSPCPDEDLPVMLPDIEDYAPKGKPPLAANEE